MFDLTYFKKFKEKEHFFLAGCDEVGRGPLAGPVVAACVSFHFTTYQEKEFNDLLKSWEGRGINDSKKLTASKRREILSGFPFLSDCPSIDQIYTHSYSKNMSLNILIKEISPQKIDEINILNASLLAMKESVMGSCDFLSKEGLVLIDGNKKFKTDHLTVELIPIIKGDAKSQLIGLASIVAKEYRDQLMKEYCEKFPGYFWSQNAGYGTQKHLEAIWELGVTEIHRKTFRGVKEHYEERG
jgi:ribonuclease HII